MSSMILTAVAPLISAILFPFFFVYAFGLWQERNGVAVSHLGSRTALSLAVTLCFQLLLLGLTILIANVVDDGGGYTTKMSLGVVCGAIAAGAVPFMLWRGLPAIPEGTYDVGRKALGINTMISSLVSTALIVMFFVTLFTGGNIIAELVAAFLYTAASTVLSLRLIGKTETA